MSDENAIKNTPSTRQYNSANKFGIIGKFLTGCPYSVIHDAITTLQLRALQQSEFNTYYLTDSYIVFTLKLESGSKITIFGLTMIVKSGLEKFILKSLHAGRWLFLLLNLRFCAKLLSKMNWKKMASIRMEEFQNYFFQTTFHYHYQAKNCIFRQRFHFEGKNDV